jgi:hypothetical protein
MGLCKFLVNTVFQIISAEQTSFCCISITRPVQFMVLGHRKESLKISALWDDFQVNGKTSSTSQFCNVLQSTQILVKKKWTEQQNEEDTQENKDKETDKKNVKENKSYYCHSFCTN